MPNQFTNITRRTVDNSYVISRNGMPYHVPNQGEFAPLWEQVNAYALAHPEEVTLEYPPSPSPLPEELEAEFIEKVAEILNAFAREKDYNHGIAAALAASRDSSKYAADFAVMQKAYDDTWVMAYSLIPQIKDKALTVAQAVSRLPALTWEE
jgi:hypothetical protein